MKTRLGFRFVRGNKWQRPDQLLNKGQAESMKVDEVTGDADARYDAMTDEERQAYYVSPSRGTRLKKFIRGH
jgi:hypothetical protein